MKTLQEISDKYSNIQDVGHGDKGTTHSYIPSYERLLTPYRDKKINFLEIGLAYGESLEMWYEFFNKESIIYGVDLSTNEIEPYLTDERFNINIVDATSPLITSYFEDDKFDVIIDDGSHAFKDQITTFNLLKNHINEGGVYIIEDVNDLDNVSAVFSSLHENCEIIDLRGEKNRYDDVLIVYKF